MWRIIPGAAVGRMHVCNKETQRENPIGATMRGVISRAVGGGFLRRFMGRFGANSHAASFAQSRAEITTLGSKHIRGRAEDHARAPPSK